MKRMYSILFGAVLTLFFGSCSLDDDRVNFQYVPLEILSASVPDTFEFGQVYEINVNLLRPNECTLSEGFDVHRSANDSMNIRTVSAIGILLDEDDCPEINQEVEDSFQFEVVYSKPYLFRFYTGDDSEGNPEFLEIEVPVNN
ncbi:hypothetical protein [Pareuzebyella sediminis]|uniref:hypothetical protein n=1 Tax=Pareuzebyella sediminis TaxID=2607998 RepID=UPI0011ED221B|nr:hypothetical protein [Pareuzebyella sediminis]